MLCLLLGVAGSHIFCYGQKVTTSTFNFTLVPGLSSVGLDPANNYSYFTFNIFSGYQRGNYYMGISGLSSSNIEQANGIQIAGLVNMVGVDYYQGLTSKEVIKAESSGEEPFLRGIQVSSLMNFVRGHSTGAQISPGMNISKSYTDGAQIGGLLNYSGKLLSGAQLGFVANVAAGSTQGVQLALYNRTRDELSGFQLGAINLAHAIEGKNSIMETESSGIQIGVVNYSKTMNGFQIGLINLSGPNQGTQIGLVNIYKTPHKKGKLDSTPFGLINIGNSSSVEAFTDETFLMNFSISTGNIKNSGLLPAAKVKHIMNQIMYRQSGISNNEYRAYGWNWQKQYYNYSQGIMNEFYFFSNGVGTSYVDFADAGNKTNLLSEIGFTAGSRLFPKNRSVYLFATVDANYFYSNNGQTLGPEKLMLTFRKEDELQKHELWPGLRVGLKLK
jgi:hypothetical protein